VNKSSDILLFEFRIPLAFVFSVVFAELFRGLVRVHVYSKFVENQRKDGCSWIQTRSNKKGMMWMDVERLTNDMNWITIGFNDGMNTLAGLFVRY